MEHWTKMVKHRVNIYERSFGGTWKQNSRKYADGMWYR